MLLTPPSGVNKESVQTSTLGSKGSSELVQRIEGVVQANGARNEWQVRSDRVMSVKNRRLESEEQSACLFIRRGTTCGDVPALFTSLWLSLTDYSLGRLNRCVSAEPERAGRRAASNAELGRQ